MVEVFTCLVEELGYRVTVVTKVTGFWWREGWAVVSRRYHRQASSFHRRRVVHQNLEISFCMSDTFRFNSSYSASK